MPDIIPLWFMLGYPEIRNRGRGLFKRPKER